MANKKDNKRNFKQKKGSNRAPAKDTSTTAAASNAATASVVANGIADELYKSYASVTWPTAMGTALDLQEPADGINAALWTHRFDTPGVLSIGYVPTPGYSSDWTSPISVCLREWFTLVRKGNTTTAPYNATETGNFLMQYGSCRSFGLWMKRLYGLLKTYTANNFYLPTDIMTACGGNYDNIMRNQEQLRGYINTFFQRMTRYHVPNLPFFQAQDYIVSNVFRDCDSIKSSFYVFVPEGFWCYDLRDTPEESAMRLLKRPEGTVEAIMDFGEHMLNQLLNNHIYNDMNADFERVHSDWLPLDLVSEAHYIEPLFDASILAQLHNANVMMGTTNVFEDVLSKWEIREDISDSDNVGAIIFKPNVRCDYKGLVASDMKMQEDALIYAAGSKLMDVAVAEPTYQTTAVVTRWMFNTDPTRVSDGGNLNFKLNGFGTEILTSMSMIPCPNAPLARVIKSGNGDDLAQLRKFDSAPIIAEYGRNGMNDGDGTINIMRGAFHTGLLDNFTRVTKQNVSDINRVRMLVAFGVAK